MLHVSRGPVPSGLELTPWLVDTIPNLSYVQVGRLKSTVAILRRSSWRKEVVLTPWREIGFVSRRQW